MFRFDSQVKKEALNSATVMNCLKVSEKKLEPQFESFGSANNYSVLMEEESLFDKYASFFNINIAELKKEYERAKKAFEELRESDEIIKRGSYDYPDLLAQTKEAPRFLYLRGNKSLLSEKRTVALVGSRRASMDSCEKTARLAKALGRNGITIISGLAMGIDASAHASALQNGLNTIAVIGTNLNQYYPADNKNLQLEIEKRGLVISQFSPATKTQRYFFPLRNGTMSGLSLATVIMEAGETSGALKQADYALEQKRLVLIPESAVQSTKITWPSKYLLRGAYEFKTVKDVLGLLAEGNIFIDQENRHTTYRDRKSSFLTLDIGVAEPETEWNGIKSEED